MILNGISDIFALIYLSCFLIISYFCKSFIKLLFKPVLFLIIWIKKKVILPKKRKLMKIEEYEREAIEFTESQLVCLKKYCLDTPSNKLWPMLFSLTEPKR
jgi:hypothetical protein